MTPRAVEIYEAAEQAIFAIIVDGKASAEFRGMKYTAASLADLERVRDYYKAQAIANGELPANENTSRVVVSVARCEES